MMTKKISLIAIVAMVFLSSCVSKKKYVALEEKNQQVESDLSQARMELASCQDEKKKLTADNAYLREQSNKLMGSMTEMVLINKKEAENLERSLEAIKEKDMQIKRMSEARSKKDSATWEPK